MKVLPVKREHVYHVWDRVEAQISSAITLGMMTETPEFDVDYVHQKLLEGTWELMVVIDDTGAIHGSLVISYTDYPLARIAHIVTMAGKGICKPELLIQFKEILKMRGATKIQGFDRPSMVRLLKRIGLKPRYTLMETDI